MSAQLRVQDSAFDRTSSEHSNLPLSLSLISAGLAAIATLSPAARGVIVASLDEIITHGDLAEGPTMDLVVDLRDRVCSEADPEIAMSRRLEEALVSTALTRKLGGLPQATLISGHETSPQ